MSGIASAVGAIQSEVIDFARNLVRTKSYSGEEEDVIRLIAKAMRRLGYDEIVIDAMGNVAGRIGRGEKTLLLDAHVDTVAVNDGCEWRHDPFGGVIEGGKLYGRGAADMKSAAAAAVYAGALAKKLGAVSGKSVYVSCTVMEEDCDGENLKHLFRELSLKPDHVVICEPSSNQIALATRARPSC